MDKEKSLLYTLYEKFTKKEEDQLSKTQDVSIDTTISASEEVLQIQPEEKLTIISEVCISSGYGSKYYNNLQEEDFDSFNKSIENLAKEYLLKKEENADCDAIPAIYISKDKLTGYIFIFPSHNEGKELSFEDIKNEVFKKNITFGVKEDVLKNISSKKRYCECIPFAFGIKPVNGVDGRIMEFSKINTKSTLIEDEHGRIDFKKLNLENNIVKDNLICKIIPPVDGINGTNILGKVLPCVKGKKVPSPMGKGTYIPENSTILLAEKDGRLSFSNGKYCVESIFKLSGNVDNSTGNIDFVGDVVVMGDVKSGFKIKAGGSILIGGTAEDCKLTANNDITIKEGIHADSHGKIEAGGSLTCKFIENCQVVCGGDIKTSSIINSTVFSDSSIDVTAGKGVIIGGIVIALKVIKAKTIGTPASRDITIKLGTSYNISSEISELKKQIPETQKTLDMLEKNINFLETSENLPSEKLALLKQIKEQYKLYSTRYEDMNDRKMVLEDSIKDYSSCKLEADEIYPPCLISISDIKHKVRDSLVRTTFRLVDGEIKSFIK